MRTRARALSVRVRFLPPETRAIIIMPLRTLPVCHLQIGTLKTERHPTLEFKECVLTSNGASCTSQSKEVTIDSNCMYPAFRM